MALYKIKEKMQKYKDEVDEADEREAAAKANLKEAEAREEQANSEVDGLRRRIVLLNEELRKTNERLDEFEERHTNVQKTGEQEENMRKELDEVELNADYQLSELETALKEMQHREKEAIEKLTEAERREAVVRMEFDKAIQKDETYDNRIDELENMIKNGLTTMQKLKEKDDELYEKEELNEEKINFFNEQLKVYVQRYDDAERDAQNLERLSDKIIIERETHLQKKAKILEEMQALTEIDI